MITRYLTLKQNPPLYLVEQQIPKPVENHPSEKETRSSMAHIWIIDRSGSMSYVIRQLVEDLIVRFTTLPEGDTVTVGWFSGKGEYRFVIKGFRVQHDTKTTEGFAKLARSLASTVGLTCFSEILRDTKTVVEELALISTGFALMFLTDGYPCGVNERQETREVQDAIEAIQGHLMAALMVGYGSYYNRELMAKMATWAGGSLIHAHDLHGFNLEMNLMQEGLKELDPRVEVVLDDSNPHLGICFSIQNKSVVAFEPKQGKVLFTPYKAKSNALFYLSTKPPKGGKAVTLTDSAVTSGAGLEPVVKAVYGLGLVYSRLGMVTDSLDILCELGDIAAMDAVSNSYTNDEYGRAESLIEEAISGPSKRFKKGRDTGYLPDPDAFCILDLLQILQEDDKATFWPRHEAFSYNRIAAKNEVLDGTLKFKANPDVQTPINTLVWNESKLNLSVNVRIPGVVELDGTDAELEAMGLPRKYPSCQFKTYTVVKDGFINFDNMPVSVSEDTFTTLQSKGLFVGQVWNGFTEPNILDLTLVPVMNRRIASSSPSAKELCILTSKETQLSLYASTFRHRIKELETSGVGAWVPSRLTPEADAYLELKGFRKDGSFNPRVGSKVESGDSYEAKEFAVWVKKAKTAPKVADVLKKIAALKAYDPKSEDKAPSALTPRELPIQDAQALVEACWDENAEIELAKLKIRLKAIIKDLSVVRRTIREAMFSMILGKMMPEGVDLRNEKGEDEFVYGDQTFVFSLKKVTVAL